MIAGYGRKEIWMTYIDHKKKPVIGCPLCGRKHTDSFCFVKSAPVPDDITLIEFGEDERDSDFAAEDE